MRRLDRPSTTRWRAAGALAAGLAGAVALTLGATAGATAAPFHQAGGASRPASGPSPKLGALLTYGYDNARSGHDRIDGPVTGLSSHPTWDDQGLDGAVYGEPLVYDGTVYVATENDSLYALAARTGKVEWRRHLGTAVRTSVIDTAPTLSGGCGDIDPLGITGTPVIDPAKGEIFVADETELPGTSGWKGIRHFLLAISLKTHATAWYRDVDPPHGNDPNHYYVPAEQQRPALTLANGRLYVGFGGLAGDCGKYHGYEVAVPESGAGALESYQVPTDAEGAIWATNGAMVAPNGDLFVATGNGSSNDLAHFDEGNTLLQLSPSLHRLSYWAPSNWVTLNDEDWDLGSAGPIQVPASDLLFVAGKQAGSWSYGYLMRENALHGIGHGDWKGKVCEGSGVFGADASDVVGSGSSKRTFIYAACGGGTEALSVNLHKMTFSRVWSGHGNGSPIVAGGLVWTLDWDSGVLYGQRPTTGHVVVQRSTDGLDHFVAPGVGDGMVLVPTDSGVEAFRTTS